MTLATLLLPDLAAVEKAARQIMPLLARGDLLALQGPLGAGKTTFARALLQALDIEEDVPSPTFTLLQAYETKKFSVYHFDFYRLASETELEELGWQEALADGLVIAEWPERIAGQLPFDRLVLHFAIDDKNVRSLRLEPHGHWLKRLENKI